MYKIVYSSLVSETIQNYTNSFLKYYSELYKDSWIWSHEKIIDNYRRESFKRYTEIFNAIEKHLSQDFIHFPNNVAKLRWRSKILTITFTETEHTRIITELSVL